LLYAWGGVERCWRRRGVATALLRPLHAFMLERGKATMTAGASLPDGHAFLAAIGAVEKQRSYVNRLDLARVDWEQLARWQAAAVPPGSGLRWEFHAGRVPMARLAELQPQFSALLGDVPLGALDMPPLRVELPSYVSWYAEMDRRGGEHFLVVLLDGADVAGICEAHWSARFPDRVYQELTGVARGWRGRGLAKALKAAMLRLVRERLPDVTLMSTFNAEGNAAILAINRRLGFTVHRRDSSYQLGREALGAWLARR
jgi:GNAT superfamily N-acetyltransferase